MDARGVKALIFMDAILNGLQCVLLPIYVQPQKHKDEHFMLTLRERDRQREREREREREKKKKDVT